MRVLLATAGALVALVVTGSVAEVAGAATPKERALTRTVAKLTKQNRTLKQQLAAERARVAVCQSSTAGAVATMTPVQAARVVLPAVYDVFKSYDDTFGYDGAYTVFQTKSETLDVGTGRRSYDFTFGVWRVPAGQ